MAHVTSWILKVVLRPQVFLGNSPDSLDISPKAVEVAEGVLRYSIADGVETVPADCVVVGAESGRHSVSVVVGHGTNEAL